jgi:hypothetical protein
MKMNYKMKIYNQEVSEKIYRYLSGKSIPSNMYVGKLTFRDIISDNVISCLVLCDQDGMWTHLVSSPYRKTDIDINTNNDESSWK